MRAVTVACGAGTLAARRGPWTDRPRCTPKRASPPSRKKTELAVRAQLDGTAMALMVSKPKPNCGVLRPDTKEPRGLRRSRAVLF